MVLCSYSFSKESFHCWVPHRIKYSISRCFKVQCDQRNLETATWIKMTLYNDPLSGCLVLVEEGRVDLLCKNPFITIYLHMTKDSWLRPEHLGKGCSKFREVVLLFKEDNGPHCFYFPTSVLLLLVSHSPILIQYRVIFVHEIFLIFFPFFYFSILDSQLSSFGKCRYNRA